MSKSYEFRYPNSQPSLVKKAIKAKLKDNRRYENIKLNASFWGRRRVIVFTRSIPKNSFVYFFYGKLCQQDDDTILKGKLGADPFLYAMGLTFAVGGVLFVRKGLPIAIAVLGFIIFFVIVKLAKVISRPILENKDIEAIEHLLTPDDS